MKNYRISIEKFLVRRNIPFSKVGDDVELPCPQDSSHQATWNSQNGWLGCESCGRIWWHTRALKILSESSERSLKSSTARYLGWRGTSLGNIQPWQIVQWVEEFHRTLLNDDRLGRELKSLTGFDKGVVESFHLGWSPGDFLPEKRWVYSNCLTIPVASPQGSWCAIYFLGRKLLSNKRFHKMRVLGCPVPYWTLYPPSAVKVIEAPNPIEAIKKALAYSTLDRSPRVVCYFSHRASS